jgi:RNA polymerase sigma-70 factor (ECF subfamily)
MQDEDAGGSQGMLTAIFLECRASLVRLVGRIVRPHEIEDIVQETFIRSYEAAGKRTIRHPRAFMLKTASNLAINHVKRAESRLTDAVEDFGLSDVYLTTETLESSYETRQRFLLFCRVVRKLPLQCRRAFLLKKVYGLRQREIAQYLGISESTVEKHIARGLLVCAESMAISERESSSRPRREAGKAQSA